MLLTRLLVVPGLLLLHLVANPFNPLPAAPARPAAERVPVVVELYTSEGCSSCPAADALLRELERQQPLAGVEIVALSEHVDYWNRLGWRDPFSAPAFTERQRRYAAAFGAGSYTPQAVVAGQHELVGSQRARLLSAIQAAAREPQAHVALSPLPGAPGRPVSVRVQVDHAPAAAARAEVLLALTETGLSSQVGRGENAGRLLRHPAVVRELRVLGRVGADGSFAASPQLSLQPGWKADSLAVVVLVQQAGTGRIVGARRLALGH